MYVFFLFIYSLIHLSIYDEVVGQLSSLSVSTGNYRSYGYNYYIPACVFMFACSFGCMDGLKRGSCMLMTNWIYQSVFTLKLFGACLKQEYITVI